MQGRANVKIASGQTASGAIDVSGSKITGLAVPAGFTGTAIRLEGRLEERDGDWFPIHDGAGAQITYTVAAGRIVLFDPSLIQGLRYARLVAGTAQGADAILTVFLGD